MARKPLDYEELNENVKRVQYAVRGELYLRASELQKEGKKIIFTNVGNPHALGQKPLTFPRQVRKKARSSTSPLRIAFASRFIHVLASTRLNPGVCVCARALA
jgi:hypothetical protein